MICRKCGSEIREGAKYCTVCGCRMDDRGFTGQQWDFQVNNPVDHKSKHHQRRKAAAGTAIAAVVLLAFMIAGLNEAPGSVNTVLNTVTLGPPSAEQHTDAAEGSESILSAPVEESAGAIFVLAESNAAVLRELSDIQLEEYETTMELPGGPCIGKYILIHNDSDVAIDVKGVFDFYDGSGNKRGSTEYREYGIAANGTGVVFGQSEDPEIRGISYHLSSSVSEYEPVSEKIQMQVDDREEKGIRVSVQNVSVQDIEDFRIRVLWFNGDQLETVAYRWLEQDDHHFYAGREKTVDFKRKWGKESYLVILQGKVES